MKQDRMQSLPRKLLGFAALIAILVYFPGLAGSFIFDDAGVLTNNPAIRVDTLDLQSWLAAAGSFGGDGIHSRWLGMLTFAVNHYLAGMDPFWFKATNLAIHLCNGMLLFLSLNSLFDYASRLNKLSSSHSIFHRILAAAITSIWLILPINLTGVLYVSQRLETLSHTFVFLGLWWYLRARIAHIENGGGTSGILLSLILCTLLGLQVKESAVLLPLFAFCIEFACGGFRKDSGRWNLPVLTIYLSFFLVLLIVALGWIDGNQFETQDPMRGMDPMHRTLTEARILFRYLAWTLVPSLDSLTFYHDDIALSHGLLDPPSTLVALLGILSLLGVVLWQRDKRPMLALGILWFFAGHLLTGTFIPLILVFEHRNYFPSVGLLLVVTDLVLTKLPHRYVRVVIVGFACMFAFHAFTTALRSREWSSPLSLAASDAAKRPNSSAAQYEYARLLLTATEPDESLGTKEKSMSILERLAVDPRAGVAANQLLIVYANSLKQPANPAWWDNMTVKLETHPPSSTDTTALIALLRCYDRMFCEQDTQQLHRTFAAATSHEHGHAALYAAYARFAETYLKDQELAEQLFKTAMVRAPKDAAYAIQFAEFLIRSRRYDEASQAVEKLHGLNRLGLLDKQILEIEQKLAQANTSR